MTGWIIKSVAQGATHSRGYRAFLGTLGGAFIRCEIQWPPREQGMVLVDLPTPLSSKARLRVPIDAVEFEHRELRHSWPLRAYPHFMDAWTAARNSGASQHMLLLALDAIMRGR